ncbi:MAG: diaminopimelate decarboxylase, partial [Longimicrobiales bacterium]
MSAFEYRAGQLFCEDVPVEQLVAEHGTPLYVYSRSDIVARYRAFDEAFAPLDRMIAYSVKANGNLAVLRVLAELGAGADIVSAGELYRAQLAGVPAERIVFSGVGKTITELAAGLDAGIYSFNVESEGELRSLADLAATLGKRAPIALRVNPDVETNTPHRYTATGHKTTKFGVPYADARRLYQLAASLPGIEVRGIDAHIGSQIVDVAPYQLSLARILELVDTLRTDGIELEFLDIGGGFGISYDEESGPSAADFADVLRPLIAGTGLRLLLEPGRFIVGPAGALLARVVYIKEMGGKTFVITDAGMNDLLRPSHYSSYHRVEPARHDPTRPRRTVDIVGPICESGDFFAQGRSLPLPAAGDLLAIYSAGAYGAVQAGTYNSRLLVPEVLVNGDRYA